MHTGTPVSLQHNTQKHAAANPQRERGAVASISLITRMRGRSLDELRVRGMQALQARVERLWDGLSDRLPSRAPQPSAEPRFDALAPFVTGVGVSPELIARAVARRDPDTYACFTQHSDALEQGRLTLLGYDSSHVGNPPSWHRDPASGIEAPRCHWSRIDHLDTARVGDHKLLWELNRHQYLLAPAFCWLVEPEPRRLDLIQSHLESWLDDNPPYRGVNWVSSLELAYRGIVWCWLLWMLRAAPWKPGLRRRLTLSLEAHARHIARYLSTYFSPNTHLTGEALGLCYIGTVLAGSQRAHYWRAKGAAILEAAIKRQVYADGVYFEQSMQYHRYTTEIYLHYLLLARANGLGISDDTRRAVADLFAVLRAVASGAGHVPLVGDDDGGLLLPLDRRAPDDVRALLLAGAVALQRPDISEAREASPSFAYWLCGIEQTQRFLAGAVVDPSWLDMYFMHGGLAVLRDGWHAGAAVAVIDAGAHGALSAGHSHADALAMTMTLGAFELLIDRGTLTYTGPERNEFRSTLSHNTLEIDATSSVSPGAAFKWLAGIPARAQGAVYSSSHFSSFFGLATGHVASGRPSIHCRRVLHQRAGAWVVHDRGVRQGARSGVLRWQLAPGLVATLRTRRSIDIRTATGINLATICMCGAAAPRIVTRGVSPRLGQRLLAQCLELQLDAALEALTVIVPAGTDGTLVMLEADDDGRSVRWRDVAGLHRVSVAAPGDIAPLPVEVAGRADLVWHAEVAGRGETDSLLAAMPTFTPAELRAGHLRGDEPRQWGRMIASAHTGGRWTPLQLAEPRRG